MPSTALAWDQSSKFVKFYVTLKNVQSLSAGNVNCSFTDKSLELNVKDLDNKDYTFTIKNLLHPIKPEESTWKIKSGMQSKSVNNVHMNCFVKQGNTRGTVQEEEHKLIAIHETKQATLLNKGVSTVFNYNVR